MRDIRSICAAHAADFLRHRAARCAARQLERVSEGTKLPARDWADILADAMAAEAREPRATRRTMEAVRQAIGYIALGADGEWSAVNTLARHEQLTVDEWLDVAREAIASREAA